MKLRSLWAAAALLVASLAPLATAQEITVAAAADLQSAFQEVADRFQKDTGKSVKLTFGSSGNFFAQIQNAITVGGLAQASSSAAATATGAAAGS